MQANSELWSNVDSIYTYIYICIYIYIYLSTKWPCRFVGSLNGSSVHLTENRVVVVLVFVGKLCFLGAPFRFALECFLVGLPSACTWKMSFKDCFEFKTDWVAGSNAAAWDFSNWTVFDERTGADFAWTFLAAMINPLNWWLVSSPPFQLICALCSGQGSLPQALHKWVAAHIQSHLRCPPSHQQCKILMAQQLCVFHSKL